MHQVRIEFLRVQTFLFAVPRLQDMIGANVLLGEVIRVDLPRLARRFGAVRLPVEQLDRLDLPSSDSDDPLHQVDQQDDRDHPRAQYQRGILARDGGHFTALFPDEDSAGQFQPQAEALLLRKLPGMRFELHLEPLEPLEPLGARKDSSRRAYGQSLLDLPALQVCQESGNGPAGRVQQFEGETRRYFSWSVAVRKRRGKAFQDKHHTRDIVGLLRNQFPPVGGNIKEPEDLRQLCTYRRPVVSSNGGGVSPDPQDERVVDYLAVIHADGNGIGKRFKAYQARQDGLQREARGEAFYHSMRVVVRRAVLEALHATFAAYSGDHRPYQVLMLGGDDLLLICQARYALPFVIHYAKALPAKPLQDGKPLTIGAGVVIAAHNLPFHRLHQLAETLAGSAKRLYRGLETPASVVDWMVNTTAWADDPIDLRRRDEWIHYQASGQAETLALSGRPYRILSQDNGKYDLQSLEGLLAASAQLDKKDGFEPQKAARSQLRQLVYELSQGRHWAELRLAELPKPTRDILKKLGIENPWRSVGERNWTTPLADLVELYEIERLGQRTHQRKQAS